MYPRRDEKSELYGYWGRDGWVISLRFRYAHRFMSGYAAVDTVDGSCGLINADGTLVPLEAICGGRTPVQEEYGPSFTGFEFDSEPRYAEVCTVHRGRRQWGLIDTSLTYRPLPDEVFSDAVNVQPRGDYLIVVGKRDRRDESPCGLFNLRDMRLELPVAYSCIYPSQGSIWVVARTKDDGHGPDRFGFYNLCSREFLPGWFWGASPFWCGFGAITEGELHGRSYFVKEDLQPAFDTDFDDVGRFSHGLAAVYDGEDAGYIDTTGRMRLLLPYDDLQPFNEFGLAIANRDAAEWDLDIIDREGRPRLTGLETAVFWEGDFPHFEVTKDGKERCFDVNVELLF